MNSATVRWCCGSNPSSISTASAAAIRKCSDRTKARWKAAAAVSNVDPDARISIRLCVSLTLSICGRWPCAQQRWPVRLALFSGEEGALLWRERPRRVRWNSAGAVPKTHKIILWVSEYGALPLAGDPGCRTLPRLSSTSTRLSIFKSPPAIPVTNTAVDAGIH